MGNLVKKYDDMEKRQKVLDLVSGGVGLGEVARRLKVSRRYIMEVLKEELVSSETPEKILEMRDMQSAQIQAHTPRLAQRFVKQSDLQNRLLSEYSGLVEENDSGIYSYRAIYDGYIEDGLDAGEAHEKTVFDLAFYQNQREQLSKELERVSKLADQAYRTYLEQQKRLSQLHGTDVPAQHHIMVSRTDQIKIELAEEIKAKQKEIQKRNENIIEAEVIEENKNG